MAYALEVDHVGKAYDQFELKDVHFRLEEGTILGLIGTNGAGKTTLIQIILGLLKKSGKVRIFGLDIEQYEKEVKDMCGFVLDENPFLKQVSAIANAKLFGPYYSQWDEKKFLSYCNRFDVNVKKPLDKLSKGTVIKFQLAFALSHNAKLFVFDEPSSGLDPIFRRELLDLMYDIIMDGTRSVIFSTHITKDLDRIADYVVMLHKGEQLFDLPKDELLEKYLLIRASNDYIDQIPKDVILGRKSGTTYAEAFVKRENYQKQNNVAVMNPTIEDIMCYLVKKEG